MSTFSSQVWDKLSQMDVAPHVEYISISSSKKLSYLPWHKAWMMLKRAYPASTYGHCADVVHADGTMEVEVVVSINAGDGDPENTVHTSARLAVMDNRFNAIANPNARDINDNRQRALVKALGFAGLGLSLWDAGSTIPVGKLDKPITAKQVKQLDKLLSDLKRSKPYFLVWAGVDTMEELSQEKYDQAIDMLAQVK